MIRRIFYIFIFMLIANTAGAATTYYVRTDGGTNIQCLGTTDAAYDGAGTGEACAFNHPAWVMGAGFTGQQTAAKWVGGDTMIITEGDYMIGVGMPNTTGCSLFWPYDCVLRIVPSGTPTSPTRILGKNWNTGCATKPVFWGTESMGITDKGTFNLSGSSNVEMQCLEITDHSTCGFRTGSNRCNENYTGASIGTYQRGPGIYAYQGSNFVFKNLDIHGLSSEGFKVGGVNNITLSHVNFDGNYGVGWDGAALGGTTGQENAMTGNIIVDHAMTRFNGCREAYPRSASFTPNDYTDCWDAPAGNFSADGWGFANTSGNWIITDSVWAGNSSDGLDLLYGQDNLNLSIDRSAFFANNGNQLKFSGKNINITNSKMFANCDYQLVNGKSSESTAQPCRAAGGVSATMVASTILKFTNNTVYTGTNAGGSSGIEWKNRNLSCNGTETYSYKNNIFVRSPLSTTNWVPFYNVDIVGACLTAWSAATTDHTIFYNFQTNPSGTGNSFTAPAWAGTVSKATYDNSSNVLLTSNVGGGTSTTFWNSSNDFNNFPQNTSIDQGALQFGTSTQLKQAGQSCVANTDCSSGTCNNFACSGSCTANGGACSTGATCCSGTCTSSLCAVANTCGDGNIQPGETCDGSNLNGSNCVLQGFTGGSLSCASNCLSFDTASCTSTTVFPLTPILDSFNRANEGPPLSSNWTTLYGGLKVSSNQVANTAGDIFSLEYWNPTNFSKDQEAYFTASTGATAMDGVSLYIKYDNVTQNGYAFRMDNPEGTMDISRVTGGTSTVLLSLAASLPPVDGDKYGLSYVSGTLKAYRNRGGSWSQIGTVADTTYQTQTGKIALGLYEFGTTARIDDFGGGSLNPVTCGNGLKETNEICDGADLVGQTCVTQGFASGTLSCATNCGSFNTSSCVTASTCGNNTKESGEICDGTDLASNTCSSRGYASGTLACASNCLSFVTTGCVSTASGVRGGMIIK